MFGSAILTPCGFLIALIRASWSGPLCVTGLCELWGSACDGGSTAGVQEWVHPVFCKTQPREVSIQAEVLESSGFL